jgi:hypothetical protein
MLKFNPTHADKKQPECAHNPKKGKVESWLVSVTHLSQMCARILTFTETHTSEYRGFAPNGKRHSVVGVNVYRIKDGKIVEAWIVEDTLDSLKKLGIIETTEKGKKLFPESDTRLP